MSGETPHPRPGSDRDYALQRLQASGEEVALRQQHAAYYLALAETAEPELTGGRRIEWLDQLEAERDNLRAALGWSRLEMLAGGAPGEPGLRLASALFWFWWFRGYWTEGRGWLELVLREADRSVVGANVLTARYYAKALAAAGYLAWFQGDQAMARSRCQESVALYRQLDDTPGLAHALHRLAGVNSESDLAVLWVRRSRDGRDRGDRTEALGDYAAALACQEEAICLFRAAGDPWGMAYALCRLKQILLEIDITRARTCLDESLALYRRQHDIWGIGVALQALGWAARAAGDYDDAACFFSEALLLAREANDRFSKAYILLAVAALARVQCDYERAAVLYEEGLALSREMGYARTVDPALVGLGKLACFRGDWARARGDYQESADLFRRMGPPWGFNLVLIGMAGVVSGEARHSPAAAGNAARLFGAAEALREAIDTDFLDAADHREYEREVAAACAGLDNATLAATWAEGRAMSLDQAMLSAMKVDGKNLGGDPRAPI